MIARIVRWAAFVVPAVLIGNACQYDAVAWLGGPLGFEAASLVGLVPYLALPLALKAQSSRWFAIRA